MALINTTTTGVLGSTFFGDGTGSLTVQQNGVTLGTYGNIPAFKATLGSSQNITASTWTKYAGSVEAFDTNNNYDSSTNYRFTPTIAGYYYVKFANWFTTGTSVVAASIYKNGSPAITEYDSQVSGTTVRADGLIFMNGTSDYLEAFVLQSSGGTLALDSASVNPGFSAYLVKAA
jgi:hypothetical protein